MAVVEGYSIAWATIFVVVDERQAHGERVLAPFGGHRSTQYTAQRPCIDENSEECQQFGVSVVDES
jgi:hypothetical protein